jgi:polyisoprenoid-binding protein YceI
MPTRTLFARSLILTALAIASVTAAPLTQKKDGNEMTYKLVHPLHHIESTSKAVVYAVDADPATKTIARVTGVVDVTTFDSGNSNRDSHAMEVIDALSYPEARFVSSSVAAKGDSLTVTGTLTFHGVTKDVTAHAVQHWTAEGLTVAGGFDISLTEFKIERPSLLMIPVQDALSFTFTAAFDVK